MRKSQRDVSTSQNKKGPPCFRFLPQATSTNFVTTETNLRWSWRAYIGSMGFWQPRIPTKFARAVELPPLRVTQNRPHIKWGPAHICEPGPNLLRPFTGAAAYLVILATTPEPTVRPPSRIAKRRPSSIAIGAISLTLMVTLSPGMTISVPSGRITSPVTSVVRK